MNPSYMPPSVDVVPGQLIVTAAVIAFVVLFLLAVSLVLVLVDRVINRRRRRADQHDVGADGLLLLDGLDAHLDAYVRDYPDVAAGFARLQAAVRDEQEKGGRS